MEVSLGRRRRTSVAMTLLNVVFLCTGNSAPPIISEMSSV
jgi:hypothetical protein